MPLGVSAGRWPFACCENHCVPVAVGLTCLYQSCGRSLRGRAIDLAVAATDPAACHRAISTAIEGA